jgi:hypothetical protein
MSLIDALAMARWLRSRTSTHRFTDTARSLTAYEAHSPITRTSSAHGEPRILATRLAPLGPILGSKV